MAQDQFETPPDPKRSHIIYHDIRPNNSQKSLKVRAKPAKLLSVPPDCKLIGPAEQIALHTQMQNADADAKQMHNAECRCRMHCRCKLLCGKTL